MPGEPVEYTIVVKSDGRVCCGTVTGPDGADVQGNNPLLSEPSQGVSDRKQPCDKEFDGDADEIFDDTIYVFENDFFSN